MGNESSKGKTGAQEWQEYLDYSRKNFQRCQKEGSQAQPTSDPNLHENNNNSISILSSANSPLTIDNFDFYCELGSGAFAVVYLVSHTDTKTWLALKVLNKQKVITKGQEEHVMTEKRLLRLMDLPFIIRLLATFQTKSNLFLGLEFVPGGELFTLLRQKRFFTEAQAVFYSAQVILALEYMHNLDIVYRDLKPENILMTNKGYLKIADLGFAKVVPQRTYTMLGTPEYIAPEILSYKGYGKAVDWWALGILIYEMLCGISAFYADEVVEIYNRIIESKVKFPRQQNLSKSARHLIKHLLEKDLTRRYGTLHAGVADIREHPWFADLDWVAIFESEAPAPFTMSRTAPSKPSGDKLKKRLENEDLEVLNEDKFVKYFYEF